ncbi:MAG: Fur family transcriptional regulator [Oscillochloridaceae bacterium umkhey_bin13]
MDASDRPSFWHDPAPPGDWRIEVEAAMQHAGLRTSSARALVLDWIAMIEQPFTAETIVEQLVVGWGVGSRPTVYRTMDWLRSAGWLARLHLPEHEHTYVRTHPGSAQVICTDCGIVQHLTEMNLTTMLMAQLGAIGFELHEQHLELYGRCRLCQTTPHVHRSHGAKETTS